MADDEIGIVLSLKQKQQMLSGLRDVRSAIEGTGKGAKSAASDAEQASAKWGTLNQKLEGIGATSKRAGKVGGALFQVLATNSQGALGPVNEVYMRLQGVGTALDDSRSKAGKWAIGIGAAMTGTGAVLGTIVSKEQTARGQLESAISGAGGNYEDFRKQIEKNIHTGERYGDTAATTMTVLNRLVLATHDPKAAFATYNSVLQIAAARHMDVSRVALQVGRAINGQARSLNAFGFKLKDTNALQKTAKTAATDHQKALDELRKAQQDLADKQAVIQAAHKKTGGSNLAAASSYVALEGATNAYNKAVYEHGKGSGQAIIASQKLTIAQARYNNVLTASKTQSGLTVAQQIELRKANEAVATAQAKVTSTATDLTTAQQGVASAGSVVDQINRQTGQYLAGQGDATTRTFTGHMHALAAVLDDRVAAGGAHVYKFLTVAGPAMMGVGAVIESGFIPKLGRLFLKITGVQKALDLMKASEVLVGDAAVVSGAEVEASSAKMATAGSRNFARLGAAAAGVALAIGSYEVGKSAHSTGSIATASLMGAAAGMAIGFSIGGPWGAAIGGAIGLIGGLANAINGAAGATERQNKATQNWMTTAYQADQFQMGEQFRQGVLKDLQKSPDAAAYLAQSGVNIGQITAGIASGGAVGGAAGLQLQAAVRAGKITQMQYSVAFAALQALDANFGAVATNLDSIAQITGVTSQHMGVVAAGAASLAQQVYAMPVPGSSSTYTPPTLTGIVGAGLPGRAGGGPVRAGAMYKVGEAGVETFVAPADGYIIPHARSLSMPQMSDSLAGQVLGGNGEPITIQVMLDRRVLAEAVYQDANDRVARR